MDMSIPKPLDSLIRPEQEYIHYIVPDGLGPLVLVQYGHHITSPFYGFGPTKRDHFLLHIIRRGRGEVTLGEHRYELGAGSAFLIEPEQVSYYVADGGEPWEYFWVGFKGEWSRLALTNAGLSAKSPVCDIPRLESVYSLLARMNEACREPNCYFCLNGMMFELLHLLGGEHGMRPAAEDTLPAASRLKADKHVNAIISYIDNAYREPLRVQEIADRMGFTRTYLTSLFKRCTGFSIKEYHTERRLQQARLYMMRQDSSVRDVAALCGYQDAFHFSKMFRRRFGMPPQEYMKSLKNNTKTT